jgi:hypothetical protein
MQTFFLWTIKPLAYKVGLAKRAPLYTLIASPQRNQKKQLGYLKSLREARLLCNRARMAANIPRIFLAGIAAYSLTPPFVKLKVTVISAWRGARPNIDL